MPYKLIFSVQEDVNNLSLITCFEFCHTAKKKKPTKRFLLGSFGQTITFFFQKLARMEMQAHGTKPHRLIPREVGPASLASGACGLISGKLDDCGRRKKQKNGITVRILLLVGIVRNDKG